MTRRKLSNQLQTTIEETIKYITDSDDYYISENGNVYVKRPEGYFKKKLYQNKHNQYIYCGISYNGKMFSKRVHRLVADAFIDNPSKLTIVGHLDNNKSNNNVSNLYWTTISDNTKKAFDDGLAHNDKSFDDSQSHPVIVYNSTMEIIDICGSCCEAARKYGVSKSTVCRQCICGLKTKSRSGYYFRYLSSLTTIESIRHLPEEVSRVAIRYLNERER